MVGVETNVGKENLGAKTQLAAFFEIPQIDVRLFEQFGWVVPHLHKIGELSPRLSLRRTTKPYPEMIPDGEMYKVLYSGVCGSDRKIVEMGMAASSLDDLPNLNPVYSSFLLKAERLFGHRFLGWDLKEQGKVLWRINLGHEIIVIDEGGQIGVIYAPNSCLKYGELNDSNRNQYCIPCQKGDHNLCEHRMKGPLLGPAIGGGILTEEGENPGAGFNQLLVTNPDNFIPLPGNYPGNKIPLAVFADALGCGLNAVEIAERKAGIDKKSNILIIGGGTIGFVTGAALKFKQYENVWILTKYDNQAKLAMKFGIEYIPLELKDKRNQTLNKKFDIAIETVGSNRSIEDAYRFVVSEGKVIELGLGQYVNYDNYRGSVNQEGTERVYWAAKRHVKAAVDIVADFIANQFDVGELINPFYQLEEIHDAFYFKGDGLKNAVRFD